MSDLGIIEKLSAGTALISLGMEKEVAESLRKLKWTTIRSPYYIDSLTNKAREIDIVARNVYHKPYGYNSFISSSIVLLVECKSLTDYHIIADGKLAKEEFYIEGNHNIWAGYDGYDNYKKINTILNKSSLNSNDKREVLTNIEKWLYPEDTQVLRKYVPPSFRNIDRYSSFRETNIGVVKELDNSVLWKSFLSLNSVSQSYESSHWNNIDESFQSDVDYITTSKMPLIDNLKTMFFYRDILRHISIHKILVIDSHLWEHEKPLKSLKYFRFIQQNVLGHNEEWIDVVSLRYLREYLNEITKYYNVFFRKVRVKKMGHSYLP